MATIVETPRRSAKALLFWHPDVNSLAESLLSSHADVLERGDATWGRFADGWPNISFAPRSALEHRDVVYVAALHHPSVFVEQQAFVTALCRQRLRSLHVHVPFFGPGTMERVSNEARRNEVATAEPFMRMLTTLPALEGGAATVSVLDQHALGTRFYAHDGATVVEMSAIALARAYALENDLVCAFPDAGAEKRFGPHFGGCRTLVCAKKRDGDARRVCYSGGEEPLDVELAHNRGVLIVDDIAMSGSTIVECARLLRARFARVHAFCVHAVFPQDSFKRFVGDGKDAGVLDAFVVTNSVPSVSDRLHVHDDFFCVCDVAHLLGAQVRRDMLPRLRVDALLARASALSLGDCDVALASGSQVKMRPLRAALSWLLARTSHIVPCAVASGVSEQPLSYEETLRGAEQRLQACKREQVGRKMALPYYALCQQLVVSVESGVWRRLGAWCDSAVIIVERYDVAPSPSGVLVQGSAALTTRAVVLSAPHVLTDEQAAHMDACLEARGARTLGSLLVEAGVAKSADAWFGRDEQLYGALVLALQQV